MCVCARARALCHVTPDQVEHTHTHKRTHTRACTHTHACAIAVRQRHAPATPIWRSGRQRINRMSTIGRGQVRRALLRCYPSEVHCAHCGASFAPPPHGQSSINAYRPPRLASPPSPSVRAPAPSSLTAFLPPSLLTPPPPPPRCPPTGPHPLCKPPEAQPAAHRQARARPPVDAERRAWWFARTRAAVVRWCMRRARTSTAASVAASWSALNAIKRALSSVKRRRRAVECLIVDVYAGS
jgi:hypothetical protein